MKMVRFPTGRKKFYNSRPQFPAGRKGVVRLSGEDDKTSRSPAAPDTTVVGLKGVPVALAGRQVGSPSCRGVCPQPAAMR